MVKECGRLIAMYLGQRGVDVLVSNVYGNMSPKNKHGRRYISCLWKGRVNGRLFANEYERFRSTF